jgi:hypothetical protein
VEEMETNVLQDILQNVQTIVSYFVGGDPIPNLEGLEEADAMKSLVEAAMFPLSTSWQPIQFRPLSDRTYNIAASCNVPPFSGWENEKFSSRLLRLRYRDNDYWLNVQGKMVTGCLSGPIEEEMQRQFDLLERLEPGIPKSHFEQKLQLVKESDWYKDKLENAGGDPDLSKIAQFGEQDTLELFLAYSYICLRVAEFHTDKKVAWRCEQLALSVLLPLVSTSCIQVRRTQKE